MFEGSEVPPPQNRAQEVLSATLNDPNTVNNLLHRESDTITNLSTRLADFDRGETETAFAYLLDSIGKDNGAEWNQDKRDAALETLNHLPFNKIPKSKILDIWLRKMEDLPDTANLHESVLSLFKAGQILVTHFPVGRQVASRVRSATQHVLTSNIESSKIEAEIAQLESKDLKTDPWNIVIEDKEEMGKYADLSRASWDTREFVRREILARISGSQEAQEDVEVNRLNIEAAEILKNADPDAVAKKEEERIKAEAERELAITTGNAEKVGGLLLADIKFSDRDKLKEFINATREDNRSLTASEITMRYITDYLRLEHTLKFSAQIAPSLQEFTALHELHEGLLYTGALPFFANAVLRGEDTDSVINKIIATSEGPEGFDIPISEKADVFLQIRALLQNYGAEFKQDPTGYALLERYLEDQERSGNHTPAHLIGIRMAVRGYKMIYPEAAKLCGETAVPIAHEPPFLPERDITEDRWQDMSQELEELRGTKHLIKALKLAADMTILGRKPEFTNEEWGKVDEYIKYCKGVVGQTTEDTYYTRDYLKTLECMTIVGRKPKLTEHDRESIEVLVDKYGKGKTDILTSFQTKTLRAATIILGEEPELTEDEHKNLLRLSLGNEQDLQRYVDSWGEYGYFFGGYHFAPLETTMKIMGEQTGVTENHWKLMKAGILAQPPDGFTKSSIVEIRSELMANMAILASNEIKITDNGLELI